MQNAIISASSKADYEAFGKLVSEYVAWCRERYKDDVWFVEQTLSHQSFDSELKDLATAYGPPNGRTFLALQGGEASGCGAYRRKGDGIVEMKRLFVPDRFKGMGHGRGICDALIQSARAEGATLMRLDTANLLTEAIALYESLGFRRCAPYNHYPDRLMAYLVFMELPLA